MTDSQPVAQTSKPNNENLVAELEAAASKWVLEKSKYTLESLRDARAAVLKQMQPHGFETLCVAPEPHPNGRCKCIYCGAAFVVWGDTSVHERSCSKNPANALKASERRGTPEEEADWVEFGDCPRCWRCAAPVITIHGFAPGCIRNCPPSPQSEEV